MRGDGVSTLYVMRGHAAVSGLEPARRGTPRPTGDRMSWSELGSAGLCIHTRYAFFRCAKVRAGAGSHLRRQHDIGRPHGLMASIE